eukprot:270248-Chlamydomonas_euryale.AAC.1
MPRAPPARSLWARRGAGVSGRLLLLLILRERAAAGGRAGKVAAWHLEQRCADDWLIGGRD